MRKCFEKDKDFESIKVIFVNDCMKCEQFHTGLLARKKPIYKKLLRKSALYDSKRIKVK